MFGGIWTPDFPLLENTHVYKLCVLSLCLSIYHINKNSLSIIICYSSIYLYLNFTIRTVQKLCFGKLWLIYRNPNIVQQITYSLPRTLFCTPSVHERWTFWPS